MSPAGEQAAPMPLFLRLSGKPVTVVGGGPVAMQKAHALAEAGAIVHVVAPEVGGELSSLAARVSLRPFDAADVDGAWLAVAAAPPEVNRAVRAACDARRVFVVAVDDISNCTALGAAIVRRGGLTVAISSDGRAPALVALLRQALDALLPADTAAWVDLAERSRREWKASGTPLSDRRPLLLAVLNRLYARPEAPS